MKHQYGVVLTQSGTPVQFASDYQRVVDTRWKTMSIVATAPFQMNGIRGDVGAIKILDHNLGYLPAFEAPFFNTRYEVQMSGSSAFRFIADTKSIYFIARNDLLPIIYNYAIDGYINVYDLNIDEGYTSKTEGLLSSPSETDMGIKIIGNDEFAAKRVNSSRASGFSMTSESKALGVAEVADVTLSGFVPGGWATGTIDHDLGYLPLVKLIDPEPFQFTPTDFQPVNPFSRPSNDTRFCGPMTLGFSSDNIMVTAQFQRLELQASVNKTFRYVLFREPTEIAG